jgi:hypothetical protein
MPYTYNKNADGLYVCPHCNVTKERQNTMHYHLKTHEGRLPYECKLCSKQFLQAYTLEIHNKSQHEREENCLLRCPVGNCSFKGTVTKSNLLIHFVRKHCADSVNSILSMNDGAYQCRSCRKEMKSSTAFYYHALSCITIQDKVLLKQLEAIQGC